MIFLYWLEDHPDYARRVEYLHDQMKERRDRLCTSVFTIGEILTGFHKRGAEKAAEQVRRTLRPPLVELIPFTIDTAERFALIRAKHRVSPADAIHLASASQSGANLFLTNDRRLSKLVIDEIDFIADMETNLLG
jgi:predicted nucleic acid-binding protein